MILNSLKKKKGGKDVFALYTDFGNTEMLKKANIESSFIVFVNFDDDTEKLVYILNLKKVYPNLEYVVTLDNGDLKKHLHQCRNYQYHLQK